MAGKFSDDGGRILLVSGDGRRPEKSREGERVCEVCVFYLSGNERKWGVMGVFI